MQRKIFFDGRRRRILQKITYLQYTAKREECQVLNQIFEIRGYEKAQRDYDNQEPGYEAGTYCRKCGEFVDVEDGEFYAGGVCLSCMAELKREDAGLVRDYFSESPGILYKFLDRFAPNQREQVEIMAMLYADDGYWESVLDFLSETDEAYPSISFTAYVEEQVSRQ